MKWDKYYSLKKNLRCITVYKLLYFKLAQCKIKRRWRIMKMIKLRIWGANIKCMLILGMTVTYFDSFSIMNDAKKTYIHADAKK